MLMGDGAVVTVEVTMNAYGEGAIRPVDIPAAEFLSASLDEQLDLVFRYGQNDFLPKPFPSVSVGDVIGLHGVRYLVASFGFRRSEPCVDCGGEFQCICGDSDFDYRR